MALINSDWTDRYGTSHAEAYVCISKITLDVLRNLAIVTVQHYHDGKAKDQNYRPILIETLTFGGEDYDDIFGESEDTFLGSIYNTLVDPERKDNAKYQEMEDVFEIMLKDKLGKVVGEEISRYETVIINEVEVDGKKRLVEEQLIEGDDWHAVASK